MLGPSISLERHAAEDDLLTIVVADLCNEHLKGPYLIAAQRAHVTGVDGQRASANLWRRLSVNLYGMSFHNQQGGTAGRPILRSRRLRAVLQALTVGANGPPLGNVSGLLQSPVYPCTNATFKYEFACCGIANSPGDRKRSLHPLLVFGADRWQA